MSEQIVIAILGSSSVAAIVTAIINAVLARSKQFKLLESADRIILKDRIKHLAKTYIARGYIMSDELEDIHEMHNCYHDLGGNGFLNTLMKKVDDLECRSTQVNKDIQEEMPIMVRGTTPT